MLNKLNTYQLHNPMPLADVAARFPTLRAVRPHESRSDKFAHLSTLDVLTQLDAEGFRIHGVQTQRIKDETSGRYGFEKHLVRLRHPDHGRGAVDGYAPELLVRNAHDGTSALLMLAGIIRFQCENGLTVGTQWGAAMVRHVGRDARTRVLESTSHVAGTFTRLIEQVETWRGIDMSRDEQDAFATQAHALRYDDGKAPIAAPMLASNVRRDADRGSDLWTVFNRVQENSTRGGMRGFLQGKDGTVRKASTRAVTGIDQGLSLNRKLFDLAESWARSRAPADVSERAAFAA